MKLQPSPFEKIKSGAKTIEIRLNDEKRQLLKVGDEIEFALMTSPTQTVKTEVIGLEKFPTFKEMFGAYPAEEYGGQSQDEWELMYKYYPPEEETRYGVLAIKLRLKERTNSAI